MTPRRRSPRATDTATEATEAEANTNVYDGIQTTLREVESAHLRRQEQRHSRALYTTVGGVAVLGIVLVFFLILPVWASLTDLLEHPSQVDLLKPLGKCALACSGKSSIFPSEVWIAIITAPLLTVSGLSWAILNALSGKKNLPRVKADFSGEIGQTNDEGTI